MSSYGFTRCEPTATEPPRLFTKTGPCTQALNRWLEGEHYEKYETDDESTIHVVARPDRKRGDMEIVEVEIVVRTLTESQLRRL